MDPTTEEQASFTDVNEVANWTGLHGSAQDTTSPRGSMLQLSGVDATVHIRIIANTREEDSNALIQAWEPGELAPSPA